jgi:hypothetical protein
VLVRKDKKAVTISLDRRTDTGGLRYNLCTGRVTCGRAVGSWRSYPFFLVVFLAVASLEVATFFALVAVFLPARSLLAAVAGFFPVAIANSFSLQKRQSS